MIDRPRFVLDTNVIISTALAADSSPGLAYLVAAQKGTLIYSAATLVEMNETLKKPKLQRFISAADRKRWLLRVLRKFEFVRSTEEITDCRDPKDNKFLELAVAGGATAIITGDRDLLDLHPFRGIQILTPAEFLAKYSQR